MPKKLAAGLYDKVYTKGNQRTVRKAPSLKAFTKQLEDQNGRRLLSQHLNRLIERALGGTPNEGQIGLVNHLIQTIAEHTSNDLIRESDFVTNERLEELVEGVQAISKKPTKRPEIPLSHSELLTNTDGDYRIGRELEREIESADQVDILVAFIKFSGFRLIREALQDFTGRGGCLRVITTAYMKVTERQVLDELIRIGGQVKVSSAAPTNAADFINFGFAG